MPSLPRLRFACATTALLVALGLLASPAFAGDYGGKRWKAHTGLGAAHAVHGHWAAKRKLTVMTQNLYLGSSLAPALEAATPEEFVEAVARIYATVQYTNFPARAEAIADEIEAKEPDLIGLQEVTKWTTEGLEPARPATTSSPSSRATSKPAGLHYEVAAISHNANIGPAPLVGSERAARSSKGRFTCGVTLEDRDVILVNEDKPGLSWSNPQSGRYAPSRRSNRRSARSPSTAAGPASTRG